MHRESKTDVLVVGAGPVGMVTALHLATNGVQVTLIDQDEGPAAHSYACALHPRTLTILDQLGMCSELLTQGERVDSIGFYDGGARRAGINLAELRLEFPFTAPFILTAPQSLLENALAARLKQERNVTVLWQHRLSSLDPSADEVVATVDQLEETAKGYMVPDWEVVVKKTRTIHASFVVGADGQHSRVRECLAIAWEKVGRPERFTTFECACTGDLGHEVRVILASLTANVLWPLPGNRCRWTFQLPISDERTEFPQKERTSLYFEERASEHDSRHALQSLIQDRAPWFQEEPGDLEWSALIEFERRVARKFGEGRCWLVGDAAHQTSPIGVQSMNIGMREATELSALLTGILQQGAPVHQLQQYESSRRDEWERLFGLKKGLHRKGLSSYWLEHDYERILPCIPASGDDLQTILQQLQIPQS